MHEDRLLSVQGGPRAVCMKTDYCLYKGDPALYAWRQITVCTRGTQDCMHGDRLLCTKLRRESSTACMETDDCLYKAEDCMHEDR